jgi:hypothetical protein
MLSGGMCLELLIATIVAWIGLWGLVEEALVPITDRGLRCVAYCMLLGIALFAVGVQKQVTVCALL